VRPTYDYAHVVTLEETNLVGNVYFVSHLRWQGHCRELFLRERAPGLLAELGDRLVLVTIRCSCEYFAELEAFDRVIVRMSLGELRESRIVMRFDYVREAGGERELVARGEQEIGCLERAGTGLRPVSVPDELREALAPYAAAAAGAAA